MKLKHILYTLSGLAMISLSACSLDEDLSALSTPDNFFRKTAGIAVSVCR